MNDLNTRDVLRIILEFAQSMKYGGLMLNERYLHHFFSHRLQEEENLLNLTGDREAITLHPEWPTYKKQTGLLYGRYRSENGKYRPKSNGTAGFIDFAIGDYYKPEIGIEFTLKFGWSQEEIVYDFLKLLDQKNPFKTAISFNVILRHWRLVKGRPLENIEERMNNTITEAAKRLKINRIGIPRELYFIITEIAKDNSRRHWHYDRTIGKFENGLPPID